MARIKRKKELKFGNGEILVGKPNEQLHRFHLVKVIGFNKTTHYYVEILKGHGHKVGKKIAWTKKFTEDNFLPCDSMEMANEIESLSRILYG